MSGPGAGGIPGGGGAGADALAAARKGALEKGAGATPNGRLEEASREFEGVLIQEMLKAMRATVPEGGLIDGGRSEEVFTALFDEHIAQSAAERAHGGLASALYRQLVGMHEAAGGGRT